MFNILSGTLNVLERCLDDIKFVVLFFMYCKKSFCIQTGFFCIQKIDIFHKIIFSTRYSINPLI